MNDKKKPTDEFFKEGDILVYAVHYDNCEPYEDGLDYIEAIFLSWEMAEDYIKLNYPPTKKEYLKDWEWSFEKYKLDVKKPIWKYEDNYENPELTIEIWNATTGTRVYFDNKHIFKVEEE